VNDSEQGAPPARLIHCGTIRASVRDARASVAQVWGEKMKAITGALLTVTEDALAAALGVLAFGAVAVAQTTPAPAPAPPKHRVKAPRKAPAKQPQPAPQQPVQQQPQAPQQPVQAAPATPQQQVKVVYSPWTKVCPKPPNAQVKQVCLTLRELRLETGQFLAGAAVIEQAGEDKKLLRITLPLAMQLPQGTRVTLDSEQPITAPYTTCIPNGCVSDYQINAEFVGKLKAGQQLMLQGINLPGQVANYPMPLADFGKAIDGPGTDPEQFQAAQKKEWEERLRRQQQQQQPQPAPPK
jgi:invasion protein IalB